MLSNLTQEELENIALELVDEHPLFYTFWSLASIQLTDDEAACKTAMVSLKAGERPRMTLNRRFWEAASPEFRKFIIIHECLHVMLDHGFRAAALANRSSAHVNIAQDVVINELAVDMFGVSQADIPDWRRYCWIETAFKAPELILRNQSFLYYLAHLEDKNEQASVITLDAHGSGEDEDNEPSAALPQELLDSLTTEELERLNSMSAGAESGALRHELNLRAHKGRVSFKRLIKHLKRSALSLRQTTESTFVKTARRFSSVKFGTRLPGPHERRGAELDRLRAALFMDVSGSCMSFFPQFEQAAALINADPLFEVELYAFDTSVQEIEHGANLAVGGGTSFRIIEAHLRSQEKPYPDIVVVVTDGYGDRVAPAHPGRWLWLLTDHPSTEFISSRSLKASLDKTSFILPA